MTPYQQKQQTKRTILSIIIALLSHLLLIGAVMLYDYLFIEDIAEFSGPVLVKLGEPEGIDLPVLPEKDQTVNDVPEETSIPSEASDLPEIPSETPPVPEPPAEDAEVIIPVQPLESVQSDQPETSDEPSLRESPVEAQPEAVAEPKVLIVSGEEAGNSWEYQYDSGGRVGRSLGSEIYLYMPLPQTLPLELFDRVIGDSYSPGTSRQEFISRFYQELNGELFLQSKPATDDVRAIWDYIIKAGYDYKNSEYKTDTNLRPVVLSFSISPEGDLLNVKIQMRSGNPAVDQAVVEGFKNAAFFNTEDREIKGRFTYRFQ